MPLSLDTVFRPRSVVVIGGSRDPASMGGTLVRNLVASYRGPLYFVHPHARSFAGRPVARSLNELPEDIELAIIAVPAASVLAAIDDCLARRVRGILVISAGFAETGQRGMEAEKALREKLARSGIPLVGPNCLGVLHATSDAPFNATFSLASPPAGDVAVCTQSGALGFVFPDYMRRWGLGLRQLISLGNKLIVGENDVLRHWLGDEGIRVVQVYLESFQEPREFLELARQTAQRRPLIVLVGGQTNAGARAAGSHTAALASPAALTRSVVRQAGGILIETLAEFFEATAQLALQPLPRGPRVAILTNAGGPGVLCADALAERGFSLPILSHDLQQRLRVPLPPHSAVANPIDLVGSTSPGEFSHCLRLLLKSDEVDHVVVVYVPRTEGTSTSIADAVAHVAREATHDKSLSAVFMESSGPPRELIQDSVKIPSFEFPEGAARALFHAWNYARWRAAMSHGGDLPLERPSHLSTPSRVSGRLASHAPETASLETAAPETASPLTAMPQGKLAVGKVPHDERLDEWLPPQAVDEVLRSVGLVTPDWGIATRVDDATGWLERIGPPVTMKSIASSILHKSRVGGVRNDIRTPAEAANAFRELFALAPDVTGVLIQRYQPGEREVIVGLSRDPRFGMVLACGLGGTRVEETRQVALRLLPLCRYDVESLLEECRLTELMRDSPGVLDSVRDVIGRAVCLADRVPGLLEVDLNPIAVGRGTPPLVLDARIRVRGP